MPDHSLTSAAVRPDSRPRAFAAYAAAGLGPHLLPIAHPKTPISARSGLTPEKLGKIPSKLARDGCVGFADWPTHASSPAELQTYEVWRKVEGYPFGIGIQGRACPAIDIDVDDPALAERFHDLASEVLGAAPCRRVFDPETRVPRSRRLLPYRSATPLAPWALLFEHDGQRHMIELKAEKQQWVAEGTHPSGGQYGWVDDLSPAELGVEGLTLIGPALSRTFFDAALRLIGDLGGVVISGGAHRQHTGLVPIQEHLLAPSVPDFLAAVAAIPNEFSRDEWLRVLAAMKAAVGPNADELYEVVEAWCLDWPANTPEEVRRTWDSLRPPFRVGWPLLAAVAREASGGAYRPPSDFAEAAPPPDLMASNRREAATQAMFYRYAWVHSLGMPVDLQTGELLKREPFNAENWLVGDPVSTGKSAWATFLRNGDHRRVAQGLTFRPGEGLWVAERLSGLVGPCINTWRPVVLADEGPVSAAEVRAWLDHAEYLIPNEREREVVLNWLAWVVQNQDRKPNFALVLGSTQEGVGKDMFLDPLRAAIGSRYVREIKQHDLVNRFTGYLRDTKLLIVQEMHSFERREMANLLKPLLASPPDTLMVELKGRDPYPVPNLVAAVFCTNEVNALALDRTGRRYFVSWFDGSPRDRAYYGGFRDWLDSGGMELVARYLLHRDVSAFDAQGRAPASAGREEMRRAGRNKLEEYVEDGIASGEWPFGPDLIALEDLRRSLREEMFGRHGRPSPEMFARLLKRLGAVRLDKFALGPAPRGVLAPSGEGREAVLYALRNGRDYEGLSKDALRAFFWEQRDTALATAEGEEA